MKLSRFLSIKLFVCLSTSGTNSERQSMEVLHRRLTMNMEKHSGIMEMGSTGSRVSSSTTPMPSATVQPTYAATLRMGMDKKGMNLFERNRDVAPTSSPSASSTTVQPTTVVMQGMGMDKNGMTMIESSKGKAPTSAPSAASTTLQPTVAVTQGMGMEKKGMNKINGNLSMGMGMGRGVSRAPTSSPTGSSTTLHPTTIAPTDIPNKAPTDVPINPTTSIPTEAPLLDNVVRIGDHFMSFVAPKATREPTREEYDEMIERMSNWFETAVVSEYKDQNLTLLSMELFNDFEVYGLNKDIPPQPEKYNIYINFDYADYLFDDNGSELPSSDDLFKVIRRSITTDFILNVARTYKGTPFESTNEVYFAILKS